jgi:hypothetical protein
MALGFGTHGLGSGPSVKLSDRLNVDKVLSRFSPYLYQRRSHQVRLIDV